MCRWKFSLRASSDGDHKEDESSEVKVDEKTSSTTETKEDDAPAPEPSPEDSVVSAEVNHSRTFLLLRIVAIRNWKC